MLNLTISPKVNMSDGFASDLIFRACRDNTNWVNVKVDEYDVQFTICSDYMTFASVYLGDELMCFALVDIYDQ